jgi:hypothetical protein
MISTFALNTHQRQPLFGFPRKILKVLDNSNAKSA